MCKCIYAIYVLGRVNGDIFRHLWRKSERKWMTNQIMLKVVGSKKNNAHQPDSHHWLRLHMPERG